MTSSVMQLPDEALALVRELITRLHASTVRYCHWKSTTSLPRALAGRTDLDLLVHPEDGAAFSELVEAIGFKRFVSHATRRFPGVMDYLGLDASSGRLVHLHVYHRLVVGQDYVKNHELPIGDALLASATTRHGVRVPQPAAELTILITRALLKYRDSDALKDLLRLGRRGGVPPDVRAELEDLVARVPIPQLEETAGRLLPGVPPDTFSGLVATMRRDRRDALALLRLRSAMVRGLEGFERVPRRAARRRYLAARAMRAPLLRRLFPTEKRRKVPAAGGLTVALVGVDGAGKSTVLDELTAWLSWRVNVHTAYMGTARPSPTTWAAQAWSRFVRRAAARVGGSAGMLGWGARTFAAIRYLLEARDRERRARAGRRRADAGSVVIFDRYPLPSVSVDGRGMDGPRIGTLGRSDRGLLAYLARREAAIYARMPQPDMLLLLAIPGELALARKPSSRPAGVLAKVRAIDGAAASFPRAIRIDASQPLAAVVTAARQAIWQQL